MIDAIIDISHFQSPSDFVEAKAAGLLGVICKATQGTGYVDPSLNAHRSAARAAGLLTGVYHFGTGTSSGQVQASEFLVQAESGDLLCLDFEPNPSGANMTVDQATDFVTVVQAATGVMPVLYGGSSLKQEPMTNELLRCPLWLAQYGPNAVLPQGWSAWALWQYSDGTINPPPAQWPGVGVCDRDRFNGDATALSAFWANHALP